MVEIGALLTHLILPRRRRERCRTYPVLPLRDIVVFPHMIVPLFVGREKSVRALEEVMQDDKQILLSSQIDPAIDDPEADGIYRRPACWPMCCNC
jgi:ATP-dependent Lon protease